MNGIKKVRCIILKTNNPLTTNPDTELKTNNSPHHKPWQTRAKPTYLWKAVILFSVDKTWYASSSSGSSPYLIIIQWDISSSVV